MQTRRGLKKIFKKKKRAEKEEKKETRNEK